MQLGYLLGCCVTRGPRGFSPTHDPWRCMRRVDVGLGGTWDGVEDPPLNIKGKRKFFEEKKLKFESKF